MAAIHQEILAGVADTPAWIFNQSSALNTSGFNSVSGAGVDFFGNVYAGGAPAGAYNLYKFSPKGAPLAAKKLSGGIFNGSVVGDGAGNVFCGCRLTIGSYKYTAVVKLDSSMNLVWATPLAKCPDLSNFGSGIEIWTPTLAFDGVNTVYLSGMDYDTSAPSPTIGTFRAINATTGAELATYSAQVSNNYNVGINLSGGSLFIIFDGYLVYSINPTTYANNFVYVLGGAINGSGSGIADSAGNFYFASGNTTSGMVVSKFNSSRVRQWEFTRASPVQSYAANLVLDAAKNRLFVYATGAGGVGISYLSAFDATTGALLWSRQMSPGPNASHQPWGGLALSGPNPVVSVAEVSGANYKMNVYVVKPDGTPAGTYGSARFTAESPSFVATTGVTLSLGSNVTLLTTFTGGTTAFSPTVVNDTAVVGTTYPL